MVKLSEFVGEVVSELSVARQIADMASVQLSQTYHADSFLKEMPVPHYTIDEAEIAFPLSVVKMLSDNSENMEQEIIKAIKLKLPGILFQTFIDAYKERIQQERRNKQEEKQAKENITADTNQAPTDDILVEVDEQLEKKYKNASNRISILMEDKMKTYLASSNLNIVKPLDVKDAFMDLLQKEYISEFSDYDEEQQPVADNKGLSALVQSVGTSIFFEFARTASDNCILVDPSTGKLSEYMSKDNMLTIKMKVREQDLDFVVTGEDENGNAKRFLSLS